MNKSGLMGAVLAAGMAVSCNVERLPLEFESIDQVSKNYLLEALHSDGFTNKLDAYKSAVESAGDSDLKIKLAHYGSSQMLEEARTSTSIAGTFFSLEAAIQLEPDQSAKENIIDSGKSAVDFYSSKGHYEGQLAENY